MIFGWAIKILQYLLGLQKQSGPFYGAMENLIKNVIFYNMDD